MTLRIFLAVSITCLSLAPSAARAQSPFELDSPREWTLYGLGAALCATGFYLTSGVDPLTADEIGRMQTSDINSFDRGSIEPLRDDHAGDALTAITFALPFTLLAYDETNEDWKTIGVMWTEALLLNIGLNQIVKASTQRARPYVYDPETSIDEKTTTNARLSFYSGHTSNAATNCFFMASVLSEYVDDRNADVALWVGAALYPALAGYLRRDSGHHFATDVIVGYVAGAAIGFLVPELHRRSSDQLSVQPESTRGGVMLSVRIGF